MVTVEFRQSPRTKHHLLIACVGPNFALARDRRRLDSKPLMTWVVFRVILAYAEPKKTPKYANPRGQRNLAERPDRPVAPRRNITQSLIPGVNRPREYETSPDTIYRNALLLLTRMQ